jgi:hypothetical protein
VALELGFGDRATALCLRIEAKGRGRGGGTSYGHLGWLWSSSPRMGTRGAAWSEQEATRTQGRPAGGRG